MNQVFSYLGEFYAPGPSITLPYTTTGVGAAEVANFRSVGDAILRADLAADAGAELVGYRGQTIAGRLDELPSLLDFQAPLLRSYKLLWMRAVALCRVALTLWTQL